MRPAADAAAGFATGLPGAPALAPKPARAPIAAPGASARSVEKAKGLARTDREPGPPADMIRPIFVLALASGLLAFLLTLERGGYVSLAALELWGRTLLAADGAVRAPAIIAAFPPLPYMAAITAQLALPAFGPTLLPMISVLFFALTIAGWCRAFAGEGMPRPAAAAAIGLLAGNPLLLRSIAEGPGWAALHGGLSMLAVGLFNLRRNARINDVILVALALPVVLLSDPFGLILVAAAIPAIVLCVPQAQMRRSPAGVMMTLLFPAAFILAGFAYANWIFNGDPWAFLGRLDALATVPPLPLRDLGLALAGMLAAAPILFAIVIRTRRQSGLRRATLALSLCAVLAAGIAWVTKLWPSPVQVAALALPLAMAAATRWPRNRIGDEKGIIALLAVGWLGAAVVVAMAPDAESERLRAALTGAPVAASDAEMAALGLALQGRGDVLFDAEAAPAAIAYRGDADGIAAASTMRFRIAGMRQFADAGVLVVRSSRALAGADAMGRTFPSLYRDGVPGYVLLHDGPDWRAWIRKNTR